MNTKIKEINEDEIIFEDGYILSSHHDTDCCESHYLGFDDVDECDWKDLQFDLSNDNFFTRIENYGIQLNALNNFSLKIPGYGSNNGYYSSDLSLILKGKEESPRIYDISDCQVIGN